MGVIKEDLSTGRRGGKKLWSTMLRTKDTDNETGFRFRADRNGCRNEKSIGQFCEIFLAQLYPIIWISL